MAFEEYQKSDEPKRQTSGVATLALVVPLLLAFTVAGYGSVRLLSEFFPLWVSVAITLPAAVLLFATVVCTVHDVVDVWVLSAIVIILTLMLVPAMLKKIHRDKAGTAPPVPVQKQ